MRPGLLKPLASFEREDIIKDKLVQSHSLPIENDRTSKLGHQIRAHIEVKEPTAENNKFLSVLFPDEAEVLERATQILEYVYRTCLGWWKSALTMSHHYRSLAKLDDDVTSSLD